MKQVYLILALAAGAAGQTTEAQAQPAVPVTVVGWPGAITTIVIALISTLPSTLTSLAAAWSTIKSNIKVEKKVAETDTKVAEAQKTVEEAKAKIHDATVKIDSAAVEREKNKGEITQQIQITQQAAEQMVPQVIQDVNLRIERHKEANRLQYELLKNENEAQIAQMRQDYEKKFKRLEEAIVQAVKEKHEPKKET